jgi:tRNA(Arg) A34 adenosine deaminase TadA
MTGARLVLDMRHLKAFRAAGKSRPLDRRCRAGHLAAMDAADNGFMDLALAEAKKAGAAGEVPVGAVLVDGSTGTVIAVAGNRTESERDPAGHAEILALRAGGKARGAPRLEDCDLYVTLEPCPMCAQAIAFARIRRLYFAAADPKGGGVDHGPRIFSQPTCHHRPDVYGGLQETRAAALLRSFFAAKRRKSG